MTPVFLKDKNGDKLCSRGSGSSQKNEHGVHEHDTAHPLTARAAMGARDASDLEKAGIGDLVGSGPSRSFERRTSFFWFKKTNASFHIWRKEEERDTA